MNRRRSFLSACLAVTAAGWVSTAIAQSSVPVQGQLLSRARNGPVPGVTVYLLHPALGRSAPSYTDANGRFGWAAIPVRSEPYYVEMYWGQNLVYRQQIAIRAPVQIPPLFL